MTAEVVSISTPEDRQKARRERRARKARERYHANVEDSRARCRASKQKQRRRDNGFETQAGRASYDPADYADEWMFLTSIGMRSDVIIARSRPSRNWFVQRVMPLVTRSRCATCGTLFNPQVVRMLTRCSSACSSEEA